MTPSLRDLLFLTYTVCITASEDGGGALSYTQSCSISGKEITSASQCQTAGAALGLSWQGEENDPDWPHGCYEAEYGEGKGVYYNRHSGSDKLYSVDDICIDEDEESSPLETVIGGAVLVCCCAGIGAGIWWRCCRKDQRAPAVPVAVPVVAEAIPVGAGNSENSMV